MAVTLVLEKQTNSPLYLPESKRTEVRSENNLISMRGKLLHLAMTESYVERKTVSKSEYDGSNLIPSSLRNMLMMKPKRRRSRSFGFSFDEIRLTTMFVVFDRIWWSDQEIGVIFNGLQSHVLQALGHQCGDGIEKRTKFRIVLARNDAAFVSLVEGRLNITDPSEREESDANDRLRLEDALLCQLFTSRIHVPFARRMECG